MNKIIILLFFVILYVSSLGNAKSDSENFIVVKIGQKIITNLDVKNKILTTLIIAGEEVNQENINNIKKDSLDSLINLRLKEIELDDFNFKVTSERLNAFMQQISENNIDKLISKFSEYGLDFKIFEREVLTEIKWRQFIYQKYSSKIKIDESTIDIEVKNILKSNLNKNEELNLSEIVIFQNENKSNNEMIVKIIQEIKKNGFENTALKYSVSSSSAEKGRLGWINTKVLSEKIQKVVEKMKINQVSDPIIEANSILLLKLNGKRELNKDVDLTNLKKKIIQQKQNEMFNLYSNSHLSKSKNKNLIEYK